MMAVPQAPSPARDLIRIHRVITRGLATGIEKGSHFKQAGFQDEGVHRGFCDYSRSLAIVLDGHHLSEDTILFPALQIKLPQAPFEHLSAQHKQIEAMLIPLHQAVDEMTGAGGDGLNRLVEGLREITAVWAPHIRMEESIFSQEALSEVMSQAEQNELVAKIGKFSSEHSVPPYLIVPFVLFNLNSEDRAAMLATMPPTMMDDLVLKAWKDQWAPMKPFLLE